ncbi:MAG: PDZ domain-containing protein [Oscillospiraceae bacterium]|nr:PDZ domain-containing protein [Oscillospiraceae bacterium]
MNKKISLGIAISLVAIGCAITFVLTWTVSLNVYNSKLGTSEKYEGVYAKLREIDATVRQNYIGTVSDDALEASTINGYIAGIGDKYASYIAPSAYYELQQTQSGVILGAGFEAEEDSSGYLKITTVYKGSSAELNGVLSGDIITAIDGKSLLSMQQGQAMERLSGEVGTRLALQLLRDGESISVNLIRQQLEIESVSTRILDGNIGYIQISSFNAKTAEQFATALNTLNAVGAKALIIDVRQNPGGIVSALKPILNQFVPSAIAATVEYSDGSRKTLIETDSTNSLTMPTAVLVDGGTVSAAELFASVLRDEAGALIVGSQTFGKGVMQNTYEFSDGSALTLSVGKIYTKSGTWNETGLKPDYSVDLAGGAIPGNISDDADSQLQKAIEVLTPKIPAEQ